MQIAVAVNNHAYDIVGILHIADILGTVESPHSVVKGASSKSQIAVGIVVADILIVVVGDKRTVAENGGVDRVVSPAVVFICLCLFGILKSLQNRRPYAP